MKKILVSLALATSVFAASAPASAQPRYDYDQRDNRDWRGENRDWRGDQRDWRDNQHGGYGARFQQGGPLHRQLDRISHRISRGQQTGAITPREADRLRREHGQIWRVAQRYYATGGLDQYEAQQLQYRVDTLQQRVRFERRDDDRRYYR